VAGYTALDHLDGCVAGNDENTSRIKDHLSQCPSYLKRKPKTKAPPKRALPLTLYEPPPEKKFLNVFPRPNVEGIRKAPFFVSASQLPFVRWKKPQPAYVSRVIRDLQEQRQHRHNRRYALIDYFIPLAKHEDEWDKRMILLTEREHLKGRADGTWVAPMLAQLDDVNQSITEMNKKSSDLAKRMLNVVNQERELVETEKIERRRAARERRQNTKADAVKRAGDDTRPLNAGVNDVDKISYNPTLMKSESVDGSMVRDALTELQDSLTITKKEKRK
jgi:hypothetical protein